MKTLKEYIATQDGLKQAVDDINEILDDFDFKSVHMAIEALGWGWHVPADKIDEYIMNGKDVDYDVECPELATYKPDYDDVVRYGNKFLYNELFEAAKSSDYEYYSSTGGFDLSIHVIDDETRERVFGKDAPDDFKHSVEIHLRFVIEENIPKTW